MARIDPIRTVGVFFTAKAAPFILSVGGTDGWRGRETLSRLEYAVCVRNAHHAPVPEMEGAIEPHASAFLVLKVRGIQSVEADAKGNPRYRVLGSDYAMVDLPNFWPAGHRNPQRYMTIEQLEKSGIDVVRLDWRKMPPAQPKPAMARATTAATDQAATDAEVLRGKLIIAKAKGVPVEKVLVSIAV